MSSGPSSSRNKYLREKFCLGNARIPTFLLQTSLNIYNIFVLEGIMVAPQLKMDSAMDFPVQL